MRKYCWIVDQLLGAERGLTFDELHDKWEGSSLNDEHKEMCKRTFHDDVEAISSIFNVTVSCDRRDDYRYKIEDKSVIRDNPVTMWLLNSYAVSSMLQENKQLKDRIIFEDVPRGNDMMLKIVDAMASNMVLEVEYKDFYMEKAETCLIEPYYVRAFKHRWYLIGKKRGEKLNHRYALDRVVRIVPTEKHFQFPKKYTAKEYFRNAFGIIVEPGEYDLTYVDVKVTDINHKREYFRSLPLHQSQVEIETKEKYSVFRYHVMPSYDFVQELLSHGEEIEVLRPKVIRRIMRDHANAMANLYKG